MSKTQLTPKQLFERRNTTDVFNRLVIIGLLRILNRKLVYQQVWNDSEDGIQNYTVPFFYDFGGSNLSSERFIQDNYTFFTSDECTSIGLKKIDGNFDVYPQGRVSLSSVSIDSGNITNRFSMGKYTKFIDGRLQTFTSYLYSMPLQFQFNLEIKCENMNTAFKIDEACREFFYKNKTYHFNYKGTVCPVRVGFPESSLQLNAGTNYVMGTAPSDNYITLRMNIQCETYQPVFDPYKEMPADCSIGSLCYNIWVNNTESKQPMRSGPIKFKTDFTDMILVSGQDIFIEWVENYMDRDLLTVDICYQIEGDEREYQIDCVDNHHFYHWQIPLDFTVNSPIDIMIPNTEYVSISTQPKIFIYPDPKTNIVEPTNVYVKGKGFFIAPKPDYSVDAIISYTDRNDNIIEHPATINLNNFMIDAENGLDFKCFVYDNIVNETRIRFIIKDHNKKENKTVSDWITIF